MNNAAPWKSDSGRADIMCKGPEVRVAHVCSQNISACVPEAERPGGRGAGDVWDVGLLPLGLGDHCS